jgi:hypothetical protein
MDKLIDETGLPDSSFSYRGDDLAVSSFCSFSGVIECLDFRISTNKLGEPMWSSREDSFSL